MLHPETLLTFQVTAPVTIETNNAPQAFRFVEPADYLSGETPSQQVLAYATPAPPAYPYPYYVYYAPPFYPYYYPYWGYPYSYGPSFSFFFGYPGYYRYHGYYGYRGHWGHVVRFQARSLSWQHDRLHFSRWRPPLNSVPWAILAPLAFKLYDRKNALVAADLLNDARIMLTISPVRLSQ